MTNDARRRLSILLIAEEDDTLTSLRRALQRADIRSRLHAVGPGTEALKYLRKSKPYADAPTPDIVFFDFLDGLPRHIKVLERLRKSGDINGAPLVLLTNDSSAAVLDEHYKDTPSCVMFSPINLPDFLRSISAPKIERFTTAVKLIGELGFVLVRAPRGFRSSLRAAAYTH